MNVRVVCAWCEKAICALPGCPIGCAQHGKTLPVSHGICPDCYAEQEAVLDGMAPAPAHPGKAGGEG